MAVYDRLIRSWTNVAFGLAACAVYGGLAVGCADSEAANRREADLRFTKAIQAIDAAERGFIPTDEVTTEGVSGTGDIVGYRHIKLREAAAELDAIVKSANDVTQQVVALTMLADIENSDAMRLKREAITAASDVTRQSSGMLTMLRAVEKAYAKTLTPPIDEAQYFGKVDGYISEMETKANDIKADIVRLDRTIEAQLAEIAELRDRGDGFIATAQKLRDEAFSEPGLEKYDKYNEADKHAIRGAQEVAEAQKVTAHLEVAESRREIYANQLDTLTAFLESTRGQKKAAEDRLDTADDVAATAMKNRDAEAKRLIDELDKLMGEFQSKVDEPLRKAADHATAAVAYASEAASKARGDQASSAGLAELSSQMNLVNVLATHVVLWQSMGSTMSVMDARAQVVMPGQKYFETNLQRVISSQNELANRASEAMSESRTMGEALSDGSAESVSTVAANRALANLNSYAEMVQTAMLDTN